MESKSVSKISNAGAGGSSIKRYCVDQRREGEAPLPGQVRYCLMSLSPHNKFQFSLGSDIVTALLRDDPGIFCDNAVWLNGKLSSTFGETNSYYSGSKVREFDIVGIPLYFIASYFYIVPALIRCGLHPLAAKRSENDPIVMAGGGCMCTNPETVADFFDVIFIGDAEPILPEIVLAKKGRTKGEYLRYLDETYKCVYVPSLNNGSRRVVANRADAGQIRLLAEPDSRSKYWRQQVELIRGCKYKCRFCNLSWTRGKPRYTAKQDAIRVIHSYPDDSKTQIYPFAPDESSYPWYDDLCNSLGSRKLYRYNQRIDSYYRRISNGSSGAEFDIGNMSTAFITHGVDGLSNRCRQFVDKRITEDQIKAVVKHDIARVREVKLNVIFSLPYEDATDMLEFENLLAWCCEERMKVPCAALSMDEIERFRNGCSFAELKEGKRLVMFSIAATPFVPEPQTPMQWYGVNYTLDDRARFISMLGRIKHKYRMVKSEGLNGVDFILAEVLLKRGGRSFSKYLLEYAIGANGSLCDGVNYTKFLKIVSRDNDIAKLSGPLPVGSSVPWEIVDVGGGKVSFSSEYMKMEDEALLLFGRNANGGQ